MDTEDLFVMLQEVRAMSALNVVGVIQIHTLVLKTGVHTRKFVEPSRDLRSLIPKCPTRILICRKILAWMMSKNSQVRTFVIWMNM